MRRGISGAPVTKWELYDTHYTERYMGDPKKDAKAYATSDAIDDAAKIRDPLLLIHGMADDNVVLDNSTAFAAKMQAQNVPFQMMFYPGKTHSAGKDVHVWTTIFDFLDEKLGNNPKLRWPGRVQGRIPAPANEDDSDIRLRRGELVSPRPLPPNLFDWLHSLTPGILLQGVRTILAAFFVTVPI